MGKLQTLLIDVEEENGPTGYSVKSKDCKKINEELKYSYSLN
ncbi:hypothetical protein [Dethiothermospora halolimnae]